MGMRWDTHPKGDHLRAPPAKEETMLIFREGQYILGVWFVRHDERVPVSERLDWMAVVWQEPLARGWRSRCRLCRHGSADVGPDAPPDDKLWFEGTWPASWSEDEVLARMETLATEIARANQVPVDTVLIQGDAAKAMTLLAAQPWCRMLPSDLSPAPR
jgi:hypothetical protein